MAFQPINPFETLIAKQGVSNAPFFVTYCFFWKSLYYNEYLLLSKNRQLDPICDVKFFKQLWTFFTDRILCDFLVYLRIDTKKATQTKSGVRRYAHKRGGWMSHYKIDVRVFQSSRCNQSVLMTTLMVFKKVELTIQQMLLKNHFQKMIL